MIFIWWTKRETSSICHNLFNGPDGTLSRTPQNSFIKTFGLDISFSCWPYIQSWKKEDDHLIKLCWGQLSAKKISPSLRRDSSRTSRKLRRKKSPLLESQPGPSLITSSSGTRTSEALKIPFMKELFSISKWFSLRVILITPQILLYSIPSPIQMCLEIISVWTWLTIVGQKREEDGHHATVFRVCLPNFKVSYSRRIWARIRRKLRWR